MRKESTIIKTSTVLNTVLFYLHFLNIIPVHCTKAELLCSNRFEVFIVPFMVL
nr:MAG TPA: hypothetical protein [Caudoviricetes sp.]